MKLPPMPWDKPVPKTNAPATDKEAASSGEGGGSQEDSGPVDETAFLPQSMKVLPYEEVSIPLKDQLIIYGRLYDPDLKSEEEESTGAATEKTAPAEAGHEEDPVKPKYPLVILIHGIGRNHVTWNDLPAILVKAGYAVFAMDLRGHGKSTTTASKHRVSWRLFSKEQWLLLPKDIGEVIDYFQAGEDYPEVDGKTVALVGEKLGANVAVYTARDRHDAVKAMVLISPGLDYKGIIPSQAIVDYTNPALLITSENDPYSYQSTERLYNWLLGVKALQVYKHIGDGSDMLTNRTSLGAQIKDWLTQQMPAQASASESLQTPAHEKATGESAETKKEDAKRPVEKAAVPEAAKTSHQPVPSKAE